MIHYLKLFVFYDQLLHLNRTFFMYLLLALNMDCFFELPTAAGWITAPDNDDDGFYDFNLNCVYVVQGMDDELIEFQVLYVDLEASSGCKYDNLSVSIDFVSKPLQYTTSL